MSAPYIRMVLPKGMDVGVNKREHTHVCRCDRLINLGEGYTGVHFRVLSRVLKIRQRALPVGPEVNNPPSNVGDRFSSWSIPPALGQLCP